MANTGQQFKQIEQYVSEICQAFIEAHDDFMTVECRHRGSEGVAYLKLIDAADTAEYFDISELDLQGVCILIAQIICGEETPQKLIDYNERKEVAKLFRI